MIDEIKSYLSKKKYYIIIDNNSIIIKNYLKIKNINESTCNIELEEKKVFINGKDLKLKKSIDNTLEINGIIESIDINDSKN